MICETADVIACEYPAQLVDLLRRIRACDYTIDCIQVAPEETEVHLHAAEIAQLDALLSQATIEFMRRGDLFDEQQLDLGKLGEGNWQAALRQRQVQQNSDGTHERA